MLDRILRFHLRGARWVMATGLDCGHLISFLFPESCMGHKPVLTGQELHFMRSLTVSRRIGVGSVQRLFVSNCSATCGNDRMEFS